MATPPVAVPVPAFDKPRHCPVTATVGPVLLIEGLHGPRTEETMERNVSRRLRQVLFTFVSVAALRSLDEPKARAQSNPGAGSATRPSFEVASVKFNPDCSGDRQD